MKKIKHFLYLLLPLFVGTQCATEEPQVAKQSYEVNMKFHVNGVERVIVARFIYDNSEKRYILKSDLIGETKAINESTKEEMYVYFLKLENENARLLYEVKRGYYGYSGNTGCFYYGTLIVGDNGQSIFIADTGVDAVLNPPMCGYWYA